MPGLANPGHAEGRSPKNYQHQGLNTAAQGAQIIRNSRVSFTCVLQPFRVQHMSTSAVYLCETRTAPVLLLRANDEDILS